MFEIILSGSGDNWNGILVMRSGTILVTVCSASGPSADGVREALLDEGMRAVRNARTTA